VLMTRFGTLWKGPSLSAFEASCLHSFVAAGHEVTLFSYEPVAGVPAGVKRADAARIVDAAWLNAFVLNGVSDITHFSDLFRYRMFERTELTWIDADLLLLRSWDQDPNQTLLALEAPHSLNGAVMRVASQERWLPTLIEHAEALRGHSIRWGETGPRLVTRIAGPHAVGAQAAPPPVYFPIHFGDFWKPFLPEHASECRALCAQARTLHLWNNLIEQMGYWKEYLPPAGSWLHELFQERGCAAYFRGEFPLRNMRALVRNWIARQTGDQLGIGGVLRQVVPSVRRTIRHRTGRTFAHAKWSQ